MAAKRKRKPPREKVVTTHECGPEAVQYLATDEVEEHWWLWPEPATPRSKTPYPIRVKHCPWCGKKLES